MESMPSVKYENIDSKTEEKYGETSIQYVKDEPVDCTSGCSNASYLNNCLDVKEEIKVICNDNVIESVSNIKYEYVEIKSEKNYSDILVQNFIDDPLDHTNECRSEYVTTGYLISYKDIPKEQIYKCDLCGYKSGTKDYFTQHQRRHTGFPEVYKCDSCEYKTIYKVCLTRHQLKHTRLKRDPIYRCKSCRYRTTYKSYLERHQVKHTGYPR